MSNNYTPHNFEKNTILTAQALNDIDDGIIANSEAIDKLAELHTAAESIATSTATIAEYISSMNDVGNVDLSDYVTKNEFNGQLDNKQNRLVSGNTIKTINGQSILGSGNITIQGDSNVDLSDYPTKTEANNTYATKTELSTLDSSVRNNSNEIDGLKSSNIIYDKKISDIEQLLMGYDPESGEITDQKVAVLNSKIDANTGLITANTDAIAANTDAITANTDAIALQRSDFNRLGARVDANTGLITANTDAIAANTDAIAANTDAIALQRSDFNRLGARVDANKTTLTEHSSAITEHTEELTEINDKLSQHEYHLEEHGSRLDNLETNINLKQDKFSLKIDDSEIVPTDGILDITTQLEDKIEELVGDTNNNSGVSETTVRNIMQESGFYDNKIELRNSDEEISFKVNGDKQVIEDSNISYNSNNYSSSDSENVKLSSYGKDNIYYMNGRDVEILFKSFSHSEEPTSISKFNNSIFRIKNIQSAFMLSNTITGTMPGTSTTSYLNCFDNFEPATNQTSRSKVWDFEFSNANNTIGIKIKMTYEDGTERDIIFGAQNGSISYDENIFIGMTKSNVISGDFNDTNLWKKSKNSKSVIANRISKTSEVGKLFNGRNILSGSVNDGLPEINDTTNYNTYLFDLTGNSRLNSVSNINLGLNIDMQYLHKTYSNNKQIKSVKIYFIIPSGTLRYNNCTNYLQLPSPTVAKLKVKGIFTCDIVKSEHYKMSQDFINIYKDGLVIKKGSTTFISSNDNGGYTEMKCESPYKTASGESLFYGIKVTPSGIEICPGNREYQSLAGYIVWCANQAISSYDNHTRSDSESEPDSGTGSEPDSGSGSGSSPGGTGTGIGTDFVGTGDIIKNRVEKMDLYEDILGKLDDHDEADNGKYYYDDSLDYGTLDPSWML